MTFGALGRCSAVWSQSRVPLAGTAPPTPYPVFRFRNRAGQESGSRWPPGRSPVPGAATVPGEQPSSPTTSRLALRLPRGTRDRWPSLFPAQGEAAAVCRRPSLPSPPPLGSPEPALTPVPSQGAQDPLQAAWPLPTFEHHVTSRRQWDGNVSLLESCVLVVGISGSGAPSPSRQGPHSAGGVLRGPRGVLALIGTWRRPWGSPSHLRNSALTCSLPNPTDGCTVACWRSSGAREPGSHDVSVHRLVFLLQLPAWLVYSLRFPTMSWTRSFQSFNCNSFKQTAF